MTHDVWDGNTISVHMRARKRLAHGRHVGPKRWRLITFYTYKPTGRVYRSFARLVREVEAHEGELTP